MVAIILFVRHLQNYETFYYLLFDLNLMNAIHINASGCLKIMVCHIASRFAGLQEVFGRLSLIFSVSELYTQNIIRTNGWWP